jgi:phosphoenolpyruvate carboxylase
MCATHKCLNRVYSYYRDFVVGKQNRPFGPSDITIAEWIGDFKPETVDVIPLFEDMEHMLDAHNIVGKYLVDKERDHQRVFLARSDPAMNYGLVSAVLLNKIALQRLQKLSQETGVDIHPIIGVGSAPFRGNLRPQTVERISSEYPSAYTFTIQSAFKYDNPPDQVRRAVQVLEDRSVDVAQEVDEERCLAIIGKYCSAYQKQLVALADIINSISKDVPGRRKRKLHTGLFGYPRNIGGITLPRAISFTAALYSIGLPPEVLGLNALDNSDLRFIEGAYLNFTEDLLDSTKYLNPDSPFMPEDIKKKISDYVDDTHLDGEHRELTDRIGRVLCAKETRSSAEDILRAANIRRFLG